MKAKDIVNAIRKCDSDTLSQVITETVLRYGEIHADWEIHVICMPKNDWTERKRTLEYWQKMLEKEESERSE